MTYSALREMANSPTYIPTGHDVSPIDEMVELFMNEAYYGRKQVQKMRDAMDAIRTAYLANPNLQLNFNNPLNKALGDAIKDAFGFKRCTVYWTNSASISHGPFTLPTTRAFGDNGMYINIGSNPNGFYDKDHRIAVAISSDLCLFAEPVNLTTDEMVGIFLHEIGHNFDYTMWGIINSWATIVQALINAIVHIAGGNVHRGVEDLMDILAVAIRDICPEAFAYLLNWQDIVMNIIPPIGNIARLVGRAVRPFMQLIDTVLRQTRWVSSVPITVMRMPFRLLSNIFLRKGEIYADSFAAAYGYGAEQVTALAKLNQFMSTTTIDLGPVTAVFNDLSLLQTEVVQTIYMGHGSTQQRALRMVDSLNASLAKADLSAADKAVIIKERDRLLSTYNQYVSMNDDGQQTLCTAFRGMVDSWYNGKSYVIPPVPGLTAYAD